MNQELINSLVEPLSHGDWVGVPNASVADVVSLTGIHPSVVVAPMIFIGGSGYGSQSTGVAIGMFHATTTTNRLVQALLRSPSGFNLIIPSAVTGYPSIQEVEPVVVAVPSMRFSSHASLIMKQ